ncbi:MAG: hypothetical protein KF767_02270 [Bdellovibrionaceae bacterium]|nr:hypothetical protein [Pseudobdellovibrionaceae bacterium]
MQKISGILPSNARIKSVDVKNSQATRPGAPNFGQRMGTTAQDRLSLSEEATERMMNDSLSNYNPKEARHARIAEEMNKNFFDTRLNPRLRESEASEVRTSGKDSIGRPLHVSSKERAEAKAEIEELGLNDLSSIDLYA